MNDSRPALHARKRAHIVAYKAERGCADCGIMDVRVLDLDHNNPAEKHPTLRKRGAMWVSLAWPALERELGLCTVRCANCHRKRTAQQYGWG